jgi:hypothetical protein
MRVIEAGLLIALSCLLPMPASAQDSITIHFLHGSRPARHAAGTEPRWLGGKLGGHVGLAFAPDSILHFIPRGKFHWVGRRAPKHSCFLVSSEEQFLGVLGGSAGAYQTTTITLPVDSVQASRLAAVKTSYLAETPYDYAFLGMRCAAATDDLLAKLGVTRRRGYWGTIFGTFHPRALRKRLLRMAARQGWPVAVAQGSELRKWQR